jgi:tetratricopeptide (TPR) repeat protein
LHRRTNVVILRPHERVWECRRCGSPAKGDVGSARRAAAPMTADRADDRVVMPPVGGAGGGMLALPEVIALAERYRGAGRLAEAEDLCWQVLHKHPHHAPALHLLGIVAHQLGQTPAALDLMRQAIAASPDNALFCSNLCEMSRQAGRVDEAIAAGLRAIALDPSSPNAFNNLAIAYYDKDEFGSAIEYGRRAVALAPGMANGHSNLGNAYRAVHRLEEAIAAHERAIALRPDFVDAYANLGSALHLIGRLDDAVAAYQRALALDPQHGNAHHGLSIITLLRGDFGRGWREYEWRWRSTEVPPRRLGGTEWRGEPLGGQRLLLHAEQGFGDVLQFCRYLPLFRERIGRALLLVPQPLHALLAATFPWLEVIHPGERTEPLAYHRYCALMSLPLLHGTVLETIPAQVPYLRVPAPAIERWAARIGGDALRVGIVWAGNPKHINDMNRSLPVEGMAPFLQVPGTRFYSLQVGGHANDIARLPGAGIMDLAPQLTDFVETAAAVAALDLVIAVDTSVAHLAGALGKPVWLLVPFVPDWRWLLDRSDTPWYPTMRLYRQPARFDWGTVLARVTADLAVMAGARSRSRGAAAEAAEETGMIEAGGAA